MIETDILRNNHLIDPQLHIWGWQIPVYLFLGGITAGLMILSAMAGSRIRPQAQSRWMRLSPFFAPLALSIGMLALLLDLENKLHVFRFYFVFRVSSPMSWGSWILLLIYPATILLGLARLRSEELDRVAGVFRRAKLDTTLRNAAAWSAKKADGLSKLNIVLGIALGAYTGILLSSLGARALWSSPLLAPLFLVSGISTGAALLMLFPLTHDEHETVRRWDVMAIGVELLLLALLFAGFFTGGNATARTAARAFFGGSFTAPFWALVVIAGLAIPLVLESVEWRRKLAPAIAAPLLLLAGGFALRWIFVAAGQVL